MFCAHIKKNAEKITKITYESLLEGIRPMGTPRTRWKDQVHFVLTYEKNAAGSEDKVLSFVTHNFVLINYHNMKLRSVIIGVMRIKINFPQLLILLR